VLYGEKRIGWRGRIGPSAWHQQRALKEKKPQTSSSTCVSTRMTSVGIIAMAGRVGGGKLRPGSSLRSVGDDE